MPNWNFTEYRITGEERELKDLYDKMNSLIEMDATLVPNGFGKSWMGNLVTILGGNWEEIGCRGEFDSLELNGTEQLSFNVMSAWTELEETRKFISTKYPSLKFYYYSEESGCGCYETNDREGRFFPARYILDMGEEIEYYDDLESVCKVVAEMTGKNLVTADELEDALTEYEEENEDVCFNFYEIEVLD